MPLRGRADQGAWKGDDVMQSEALLGTASMVLMGGARATKSVGTPKWDFHVASATELKGRALLQIKASENIVKRNCGHILITEPESAIWLQLFRGVFGKTASQTSFGIIPRLMPRNGAESQLRIRVSN